ncbi:MAG TPA: right-handed parallel beta-helix repeat-containing protein, partial [Candidatus Acidoferrum sp.]|nr:right-handed parallel beta-helix repeat-containing protein [Candidatus Acidoferrum sp.]
MKHVFLAAFLTFAILYPSSLHAQGSLTPPGPPGPTMLTLSQIEPRTPISGAPMTILTSGSYYLTTNLTVGSASAIVIDANNVTLDLNGFTISSPQNPPLGVAILLGPVTNITIVNGFISGNVTNNGSTYSGSGFGYGIYCSQSPGNVRISDVSISGCEYYGIYLGANNTVVESCTINTMGSYGIYAHSVTSSTALNCGGTAIDGDIVNNCQGSSSGSGYGIYATYVATGCYGQSVTGTGIYAYNAAFCTAYRPSGTAIE